MGLIVYVLALILLVCCWIWGDLEFRTKLIVTGVYLATWFLAFADLWFVVGSQSLFCIVVGMMTFGPDWGKGS